MSYAAAILMIAGSLFCMLAALGLIRFPDLYTRLHAAAKAGPIGSGLILLGAGVASGDAFTLLRAALGLVFLVLTTPIAAHLLARAAMRARAPAASIARIDEFENSSDPVPVQTPGQLSR